ncbi:1221_t:CDS:2 [Diversispora eburnea]|uniref:1221_t:CDS:1 n=1 Tax=Diversispora eburnea TaxID=1213867 RepID=A0A9N8Z4I2_9GLOM|nr:1221_t:CDS:2 [Diversispora eburnea]
MNLGSIKVPFPPPVKPQDFINNGGRKFKTISNRSLNAFFIYRRAYLDQLRVHGIKAKMTDVSPFISSSWKNEPSFVRDAYKEIACQVEILLKDIKKKKDNEQKIAASSTIQQQQPPFPRYNQGIAYISENPYEYKLSTVNTTNISNVSNVSTNLSNPTNFNNDSFNQFHGGVGSPNLDEQLTLFHHNESMFYDNNLDSQYNLNESESQ